MFLRVSSLQCASHVEGNPCRCLPLPRPSTRCGVVNPQRQQVCGGLASLLQLPLRSTCRGRRRGGVGTTRLCSRWRTSRPASGWKWPRPPRSEEHTSELQSRRDLVCRLLLEKKKKKRIQHKTIKKKKKKKQTK